MRLSINSSTKMVAAFLVILISLPGCGKTRHVERGNPLPGEKVRIAVLPVENLSGAAAPLTDTRRLLAERLRMKRVDIVDQEALENSLARNRIRYTGGLDAATSRTLKQELGVSAVLITSVDLSIENRPPKIALTSRLVSAGTMPEILWMESIARAGDESPGILGLGLIEDPGILLKKTVNMLSESLARYLAGDGSRSDWKRKTFRPQAFYRSPAPDRHPAERGAPKEHDIAGAENRDLPTVAVIPFFNQSLRKNAEDILALHFVRHLRNRKSFRVIEPGVVRERLLSMRVVMDQGVSLADAEAIFNSLDVDLILTGKVLEYRDYEGYSGRSRVDFSVQVMERATRKIVWASKSSHEGDEGVLLFDWGKLHTASAVASEMARCIVEKMAEE